MPSTEQKDSKIATFKRVLRFTPSIGDWTTFRASKTDDRQKVKLGLRGFDRLSEEELITSHLIHYHFAQRLLKKLRVDLGIGGELYSVSVEQIPYQEFLRRTAQPVAQFKISTPEAIGISLFLDLPLASSIINRALGTRDTSIPTRPLTALEESIMSTVINEEFSELANSYKNIIGLPEVQYIGSPLLAADPLISFSETFILFSIEISLGETVAKLTLGYQYETIKSLLQKYKAVPEEKTLNLNKLPASLCENIRVPVVADLGSSTILTKELSSLEEGDVVSLDTRLDNLMPIIIGNRFQLSGRPGIHNGRLAVRLTKFKQKITREESPAVEELNPAPDQVPAETFATPLSSAEDTSFMPEYPMEEEKSEEDYPLEGESPLEEAMEMGYPFDENQNNDLSFGDEQEAK